MSILSKSFFAFVRCHLVALSFFSARHLYLVYSLKIYLIRGEMNEDYFTSSMKTLAGLNAGILCSGIMIVVFFEMLRAVF